MILVFSLWLLTALVISFAPYAAEGRAWSRSS
jgi:hypothetical protein